MDSALPVEIQRQINAAEGWLDLGSITAANDELEEIPATMRAHPKVLMVRLLIYSEAKKWEACLDIADAIVGMAPNMDAWLHRSFALHELKRTKDAYEQLLPALERFKDAWLIPYNLACYCCQLGRILEAEKWLSQAIDLDGEQRKTCRDRGRRSRTALAKSERFRMEGAVIG
jgi:tetratricopeptide (TPR) repeat protein